MMMMARGRKWERRESVWMILSLAAVLPAAGFSCCGRHAAASLVGRGEVGTHGPADGRCWTQRHVRLMMQRGEGRDDWRDSEERAIALPRSLPSLGRLVISTSEPNVPIPPKPSRFARLLSLIGIRRQGRGMRRRGVAKPAAGVGATVGFMAGGPFGAMLGAVAGAFASTREGAAGEAVRTTAKAAGVAWDMSSKAASAVGGSAVGDMLDDAAQTVKSTVDRMDDALNKKDSQGP